MFSVNGQISRLVFLLVPKNRPQAIGTSQWKTKSVANLEQTCHRLFDRKVLFLMTMTPMTLIF